MLKEWEKSEKPSEEEIKARLEAVKEKLARQQLLIKEKKVPFCHYAAAGSAFRPFPALLCSYSIYFTF